MISNIKNVSKALFLGFLLFAIQCQADSIHTVEAFGVLAQKFANNTLDAKICYLDQYQTNLAALNEKAQVLFQKVMVENPTEEDKLRLQSGETFASQYKSQLKAAGQAFKCRYDAKLLGVTKLPAIVFDGKYVIYGQTDIGNAYHDFQNSQIKEVINAAS